MPVKKWPRYQSGMLNCSFAQNWSNRDFNWFIVTAFTTASGRQFQSFITRMLKQCLLISFTAWGLTILKRWPLVICLSLSVKNLLQSNLSMHFTILNTCIISPLLYLVQFYICLDNDTQPASPWRTTNGKPLTVLYRFAHREPGGLPVAKNTFFRPSGGPPLAKTLLTAQRRSICGIFLPPADRRNADEQTASGPPQAALADPCRLHAGMTSVRKCGCWNMPTHEEHIWVINDEILQSLDSYTGMM